jgi:hypothetical protein
MRLPVVVLLLALPAAAHAEPTPLFFQAEPDETLAQTDLGLTWDTGGGRLAGAELSVTADWRGFGILARADYQLQRQTLTEQGVEFTEDQGSGAVGVGVHLSPVRMLDLHLGRVVDVFGEAGFQGGASQKAGGWALRGAGWVGAGAAIRFPLPHRHWLPAIFVRWQHRSRQPDFVFADALTLGIGFATLSADVPRD